jgi:hypothetical protein
MQEDSSKVGQRMNDRPSYPGTPRWVKLSAIVALVLVLLVVAVMAAVGGEHGPGRHVPAGGADPPVGQVAPKQ